MNKFTMIVLGVVAFARAACSSGSNEKVVCPEGMTPIKTQGLTACG